jgi:hypothetical protein
MRLNFLLGKVNESFEFAVWSDRVFLLLSGCANLNSIHRSSEISGDAKLNMLDAKQRVVISGGTAKEGSVKVCAEPSPDAIQSIAASAGASFSDAIKSASLQAGSSESAGSIGLRTQSITILRDGMYRACEGYLSGALDKGDFESIHRRYQSVMLGLLAIEQLAGAVSAKQLILGGAATKSSSGDVADKAAEDWAQAKQDAQQESASLTKAEADLKKAQAAKDAAPTDDKDLPAKTQALDDVLNPT